MRRRCQHIAAAVTGEQTTEPVFSPLCPAHCHQLPRQLARSPSPTLSAAPTPQNPDRQIPLHPTENQKNSYSNCTATQPATIQQFTRDFKPRYFGSIPVSFPQTPELKRQP